MHVPRHILLSHGYDSSPARLPAGMQHNTNPAFLLKTSAVLDSVGGGTAPGFSEFNINPVATTTTVLNYRWLEV